MIHTMLGELSKDAGLISKKPEKKQDTYLVALDRGSESQEIYSVTPLEELGQGNFGIVHKVSLFSQDTPNNTLTERVYAIKSLHPDIYADYSPPYEHYIAYGQGDWQEFVADERRGKRNNILLSEEGLHHRMREADMKVLPITRAVFTESGECQLVKTFIGGDSVCLGDKGNESFLATFGLKRSEISNLEALVEDLFRQVKIATKNGWELRSDMFFFVIDKNSPDNVDFVIGDTGPPPDYGVKEPKAMIFKRNVEAIQQVLQQFVSKNVAENSKEMLLHKIELLLGQGTQAHASEFKTKPLPKDLLSRWRRLRFKVDTILAPGSWYFEGLLQQELDEQRGEISNPRRDNPTFRYDTTGLPKDILSRLKRLSLRIAAVLDPDPYREGQLDRELIRQRQTQSESEIEQ